MRWPKSVAAAIVAAGVVGGVPAAADSGLPPCPQQAATITPKTKSPHQDCRLNSGDHAGLGFDVRYWTVPEAPGPRAVKVLVTDPSGAQVQTIDELLEPSSPGGAGVQDVDGDGRNELIIPIAQHVFNGASNTRFSVWRAAGAATHFERTQMVGQAVYPSGDGYVVSNGGAPGSRDLTFYLPTDGGLTLVVVLTIAAEQVDPDTQRVLTVSCRAHQVDGLHAVDMDVYQAEDTFCASPAAQAIWPGAQRIALRPWPRPGS